MSSPSTPVDKLDISLRAFAVPNIPKRTIIGGTGKSAPASPWTLVFDTETTIDRRQALRFGTYLVMNGMVEHERGLLYADDLPLNELDLLKTYAAEHGLVLHSRESFVDEVFYRFGYDLRGRIIGFNLPFDLARIALRAGSARGRMYGGFSLKLSEQKFRTAVQIKHQSARSARIQFAAPYKPTDGRSRRNQGKKTPTRRGFFVDVSTFASALFAKRFSLESLCGFLQLRDGKLQSDAHGGPLTRDYIAYAVRDTEATWACYAELSRRYEAFHLPAPDHQIYSEAGIGKAYLSAMGVQPWRKMQPDFSPEMMATILSTYFGGRSEVRIRREVAQVVLCDFLSMYPTVGVLQGLWKFVCARGMTWRDGTSEVRAFLDRILLADLQRPATWLDFTALLEIEPDEDIVPVRAQYSEDAANTIGLNHLISDRSLWFTLADCVASKLLTGRVPKIRKALVFQPGEPQGGLRPVQISGKSDYAVNPGREDFFKRVIELRHDVKRRMSKVGSPERESLAAAELALKIVANATGYGCYVQVNVREHAKKITVRVHQAAGEPFEMNTKNEEEPGPFFHPLLATLITGAARLMLAITETLVANRGLTWAFCDTDSMAIAKPEALSGSVFLSKVRGIADWFAGLNPYDFGGSILKIEGENYSLDQAERHEPLYVWAVSAKRYALFNMAADGTPILRKVSAHGLGHLIPPYDEQNPPPSVPRPRFDLAKSGVALWHHDLWWQIVRAALDGHPDQVDLSFHTALSQPAMSRYAATTPKLLHWFKLRNDGKPYRDQVKPFGFMFSLFADPFADDGESHASTTRRKRATVPRPVALFDQDRRKAAGKAFDRETDGDIPEEQLQSYRATLAPYHLHPEAKFLNGSHTDRGKTRRRTVSVDQVHAIGKEANRLEEQVHLRLDDEAQVRYSTDDAPESLSAELRETSDTLGRRELAFRLGISRATLSRLISGDDTRLNKQKLVAIKRSIPSLKSECTSIEAASHRTRAVVTLLIDRDGLQRVAETLEIDPSNLLKISKGGRTASRAITERIKIVVGQ